MSLILQLETSAKRCSAAISKSGSLLASEGITTDGYAHAEMLHVLIGNVIKSAGTQLYALNAVAISKGPGSYTGLRIGVSAAKGLCYASDIPLIAIDTTEIIASHAFENHPEIKLCAAMIDARRMEVYLGVYNRHQRMSDDSAVIVDNEFLNSLKPDEYVLAGDGADKADQLQPGKFKVMNFLPSAEMMTSIAFSKYQKENFENMALFEPYYLKDYLPGVTKKTLL